MFSFANAPGNVFHKVYFKNLGFLTKNYVYVYHCTWRDIVHLSFHPARRILLHVTINMALSTELAAFAVMFLCCIEACSYNSDCLDKNTSDVQCCNGHCIDKYSPCYSLVPILSLIFLAVGVVIICIIGCCSCYPFCPGFGRYRSNSMRTYIIEAPPVYQQVASDPSTADMAEASSTLFYPQFLRFQHDQPISGQPNPYPPRQLGENWLHTRVTTYVGHHTMPAKTAFAE